MSQGSTALKHWTVSLQLVSKLEVQDEKYKKAHITKSQGVQIQRRRNSFRTCRPQTTTQEVLNNEDQICRSVSLASGDVLLVVEEEGQKAKCCCCSFVKVKQEFFVGFFWVVTPGTPGSRQCWQFPPQWYRCCRRTGGFSRLPASR